MPLIECQVCSASADARFRCDGCLAFAYCTSEHKMLHWLAGHKEDCRRIADQMARRRELESVQGLWMQTNLCDRLIAAGCHGKGPWRRECECAPRSQSFGNSEDDHCWQRYRAVSCGDNVDVHCWKDMCDCLGVSTSSPLSLVLDYVATMFWALKICGIQPDDHEKQAITIHVLGPEKELDQLCTFSVLGVLNHKVRVDIYFVGPAISQNSSAVLGEAVHVNLVPGLYHEVHDSLPPPDVTMAFNAGLAAYPSWIPTLQVVKRSNVPFFCTDYCEEAVFRSLTIMHSIGMDVSEAIRINPFRKPLMISSSDNDLPSCSNGFYLCFKIKAS